MMTREYTRNTKGQVRQAGEAPAMPPVTQRAAVRFHFLHAVELIQEECKRELAEQCGWWCAS